MCHYSGWISLLQPRRAALQAFPQLQANATVDSYVLVDDEQLKHLALLMHHCYARLDLTARCIAALCRSFKQSELRFNASQ